MNVANGEGPFHFRLIKKNALPKKGIFLFQTIPEPNIPFSTEYGAPDHGAIEIRAMRILRINDHGILFVIENILAADIHFKFLVEYSCDLTQENPIRWRFSRQLEFNRVGIRIRYSLPAGILACQA